MESPNYQVCCQQVDFKLEELASQAEKLRDELREGWLGTTAKENWVPRCQIVVFGRRSDYVAAVGRGSEQTVGSSLISVQNGAIIARRIDLLLEPGSDIRQAALPHELTHVVLRDRFPGSPLPRWADEGASLLADPPDKQQRHRRDWRSAASRGSALALDELFNMRGYPRRENIGNFYGQSAAVVEYLISLADRPRFLQFLKVANESNYDRALRECYDLDGVVAMERMWQRPLTRLTVNSDINRQ